MLCLLSHIDTVLATPAEWQRDPWSGDLVDGEVWGRGAQDMKSQTAGEVAAALDPRARRLAPGARATCSLVCVVDEETGGWRGRDVALPSSTRKWCAATTCSTRARAR